MFRLVRKWLGLQKSYPPKWLMLLAIPWVLVAGALGASNWIDNGLKDKWKDMGEDGGEDDRVRHHDFGGWWAPEMHGHWVRWFKKPFSRHDTKNLGSEYFRDDAQRAYKYMSFALVLSIMVNVALGLFVI